MRICLVAHGFPPHERTGVENYTAALAHALASRGHRVRVFAPRRDEDAPHLSVRREVRGPLEVHWLAVNQPPPGPREHLDLPAAARQFGQFLDRERPDVVHFQHVVKLGIGLLRETRARAIPSLYTAHDYYAICHRYTLLRPDLAHCDVRGDAMACARCDTALGYLNRKKGLGDYQMGVLRSQLEDEEWAALQELLDDDPEASGLTQADVDAAFDLRRELDGLRAEAFACIDRIIAPSRYLRDELVRGGIDAERIEVLDYGIENEDLLAVPPIEVDGSKPLRFGFFGGLSKHKGVHVLIEAFRRASAYAELSIWGYSTDEPYVEHLRRSAGDAGVVWRGPYERADLPELMAQVDVVVVPSIWVENQPLVIREAFSARRPVIASDIGALPESVRDGVDGLLFAVGDADSLAKALERCAGDPELVRGFADAIRPVKGVDVQADELLERYAALIEEVATPTRDTVPASLAGFADRFDRWNAMPLRELFDSAFVRLGTLGERLGASAAATDDVLLAALSRDEPKSQLELRDAREEQGWLRESVEDRAKEAEWLRDTLRDRDEEIAWLRTKLGELDVARAQAEKLRAALDEVEHELREAARLGLAAIEVQEELIDREMRPVLADLQQLFGGEVEEGGGAIHLARVISQNIRLALFELTWRREEMRVAGELTRRRYARYVLERTGLGRRVASWKATDEAMSMELGAVAEGNLEVRDANGGEEPR